MSYITENIVADYCLLKTEVVFLVEILHEIFYFDVVYLCAVQLLLSICYIATVLFRIIMDQNC